MRKIEVEIKEKEFEEAVARKNMTFTELAAKLGINRVYLSNIKNDRTPGFRPSGKLRDKMMAVLGVQFDDIFRIVKHTEATKR